jgi:hypothetical protein
MGCIGLSQPTPCGVKYCCQKCELGRGADNGVHRETPLHGSYSLGRGRRYMLAGCAGDFLDSSLISSSEVEI